MLDLALHSPPQSSIMGTNTSTTLIAHSRRPAILTYTSPLVNTAHTLSRMPFYLIGLKREAETLDIPMFENIEFARGWRNVPASLKLEIQSREQMQVYGVEVKFRAKFRGLRCVIIFLTRKSITCVHGLTCAQVVNVQVETSVILHFYIDVLVRLHDIKQYCMAAGFTLFGLDSTR